MIADEIIFRGFHPDLKGEEQVKLLNNSVVKGQWMYWDAVGRLRVPQSGELLLDDEGDPIWIYSFGVLGQTVGQRAPHDKNVKLLFCGDIVEDEEGHIFEVIYDGKEGTFALRSIEGWCQNGICLFVADQIHYVGHKWQSAKIK